LRTDLQFADVRQYADHTTKNSREKLVVVPIVGRKPHAVEILVYIGTSDLRRYFYL
jgi:hypothetical protein